jgi:integrase
LIENSEALLRHIILVALNKGMRKAEILNLEWDQVNLEKGFIRIEAQRRPNFRLSPCFHTGTWTGKRLRGELLVLLKDKAGLKYKEISEISVFSNLSFSSLRDLYGRTRKRAK